MQIADRSVFNSQTWFACLVRIARIEVTAPVFSSQGLAFLLRQSIFQFALGFAASSERNEFNVDRSNWNRQKRSTKHASSKPTTKFAQPRLSRVKGRSSPARGYKFGCVCSYMASHENARVMTGHIGTNTPKFVPPRWGRPPFNPTQAGLSKFGCGFGARWLSFKVSESKGFSEKTGEAFSEWVNDGFGEDF